jgi:D-arabinose 1-dehydrogenase-like Zn-dependent alcohol dehydrogenase
VPGHEVVGVVDAVGAGIAQSKPGQRVIEGPAMHIVSCLRTAANFPVSGKECGALPRRRYTSKVGGGEAAEEQVLFVLAAGGFRP